MLRRKLLAAVLICTIHPAFSAPARCSYGYQDATCTPAIAAAPQPQPMCPNAAGWTTIASSQWIGSQWSSPQCNYTPPPTCPAGYSQASSAWWTGTSWVPPTCNPPAPPPSDDANPIGYCTPLLAPPGSGYTMTGRQLPLIGWPEVVSGTQNNPYEGQLVYAWYMTGPTYSLPCRDDNEYVGSCYFSSADHHFLGAAVGHPTASSGQCNH